MVAALRVILEQNGMINLFAVAFATLLLVRNAQGFHERLLFVTSTASLVADCLLIFTGGPVGIVITALPWLRFMNFVEVLCWTIREVGLCLYTNKLIEVLDVAGREQFYHRVFRFIFGVLILWRSVDMCLRTYDPSGTQAEGSVVRKVDPLYLGTLSALELFSAAFLTKLTLTHIRNTEVTSNVNRFATQVLRTGLLRVVAVDFIPAVRLIMNQSIASSFNYGQDASSIIYSIQVSMNLMFLMDLALVKIDSTRTFRACYLPTTKPAAPPTTNSTPKSSVEDINPGRLG
ncbi:hypothetical protein HKX48_008025 [Thoreauomyces humboldtii]|nr:hypothetical protein HKX48_008025 [Thoreauomyces humboldtii]